MYEQHRRLIEWMINWMASQSRSREWLKCNTGLSDWLINSTNSTWFRLSEWLTNSAQSQIEWVRVLLVARLQPGCTSATLIESTLGFGFGLDILHSLRYHPLRDGVRGNGTSCMPFALWYLDLGWMTLGSCIAHAIIPWGMLSGGAVRLACPLYHGIWIVGLCWKRVTRGWLWIDWEAEPECDCRFDGREITQVWLQIWWEKK